MLSGQLICIPTKRTKPKLCLAKICICHVHAPSRPTYLEDFIARLQSFLGCRAAWLHGCDKDADLVPSRQPNADGAGLLEADEARVGAAGIGIVQHAIEF